MEKRCIAVFVLNILLVDLSFKFVWYLVLPIELS